MEPDRIERDSRHWFWDEEKIIAPKNFHNRYFGDYQVAHALGYIHAMKIIAHDELESANDLAALDSVGEKWLDCTGVFEWLGRIIVNRVDNWKEEEIELCINAVRNEILRTRNKKVRDHKSHGEKIMNNTIEVPNGVPVVENCTFSADGMTEVYEAQNLIEKAIRATAIALFRAKAGSAESINLSRAAEKMNLAKAHLDNMNDAEINGRLVTM